MTVPERIVETSTNISVKPKHVVVYSKFLIKGFFNQVQLAFN